MCGLLVLTETHTLPLQLLQYACRMMLGNMKSHFRRTLKENIDAWMK